MTLTVGVPKEIKTAEHRVAMTPDGVRELETAGVAVFIQAGAGADSRHRRRRLPRRRGDDRARAQRMPGLSRWS